MHVDAFVLKMYVYHISQSLPSAHGATSSSGPGPPQYRGLRLTLGHTTLRTTHLDEWSDRRRELFLTTHNT